MVLEATQGGRSLRHLANHAASYTSALVTSIINLAAAPTAALAHVPAPLGPLVVAGVVSLAPFMAGTAAAAAPAAPAQAVPACLRFAAMAWALRCLESVAGREGSFQLHAAAFTSMAQAAAAAVDGIGAAAAASGAGRAGMAAVQARQVREAWVVGGDVGDGAAGAGAAAAATSACCALLASLLRHRGRELRRAMAPVVHACRGLLLVLAAWGRREGGLAGLAARGPGAGAVEGGWGLVVHCAEQLARVYQAVVDQKELLGRYCHLLLADYVVVGPFEGQTDGLTGAGGGAAAGGLQDADGGARAAARAAAVAAAAAVVGRAEAGAALRRGAHALYGAATPAELQHVHIVVGQGALGQARRAALAELRASYDKEFKYAGKT